MKRKLFFTLCLVRQDCNGERDGIFLPNRRKDEIISKEVVSLEKKYKYSIEIVNNLVRVEKHLVEDIKYK